MEELAYLFSCVAVSYREMEDVESGEILNIEPKLSSVYKNIEKSFPRWKVITSNTVSYLRKLVIPCLDFLETNIANNKKVISLLKLGFRNM